MGKDTVYRIEERKHPHKPVIDFIRDVFNPSEKVNSHYTKSAPPCAILASIYLPDIENIRQE
jgi:hypothetical protein